MPRDEYLKFVLMINPENNCAVFYSLVYFETLDSCSVRTRKVYRNSQLIFLDVPAGEGFGPTKQSTKDCSSTKEETGIN
jgi:hypothetical protein